MQVTVLRRINRDFNAPELKSFTFEGENFSSIAIDHSIGGLSTCNLRLPYNEEVFNPDREGRYPFEAFDSIYVEDEGRILFGGLIVATSATSRTFDINCYEHRWIYTRLTLDQPQGFSLVTSSSEALKDTLRDQINRAIQVRQERIIFDEDTEISGNVNLFFSAGETLASVITGILEATGNDWVTRYRRDGINEINGYILSKPSPRGVGRNNQSRKEPIKFVYREGDDSSNIRDFNFGINVTKYNSRTNVITRIGGFNQYFESMPNAISSFFEQHFGITQESMSDYSVQSQQTANFVGQINQKFPSQKLTLFLEPNIKPDIQIGDYVTAELDSRIMRLLNLSDIRIDELQYRFNDGILNTRISVELTPSFKKPNITLDEELADIDKQVKNLNRGIQLN